jgi:hypothetical protein
MPRKSGFGSSGEELFVVQFLVAKKIGDPPLIHTVRYVGYTICQPV